MDVILTAVITSCISPLLVLVATRLFDKNAKKAKEFTEYTHTTFERLEKNQKLILECTQSILRGNIVRVHEAHIAQGSIPKVIYDATAGYYTEYKKLGGNGFVDKLWADIEHLKLGG